jgi:putative flippase GtrA
MRAIANLWHESTALRFVIIGGGCAVLYFAVCLALATLFDLSPFLASFGAYLICFWVGYSLQRGVTFRSKARHRVTLTRYAAWHLFGATAVSAATDVVASASVWDATYIALFSTLLCSAVSFFISSRWVFKDA